MNEKREDNLIFETYAMVNEDLTDADHDLNASGDPPHGPSAI